MAKHNELELEADDIVDGAIVMFLPARSGRSERAQRRSTTRRLDLAALHPGEEQGCLDRHGGQPTPRRSGTAGRRGGGVAWYAERWCRESRSRLKLAPDSRLYLGAAWDAYVEASRPSLTAIGERGLSAELRCRRPDCSCGLGLFRGHATGVEHACSGRAARASVRKQSWDPHRDDSRTAEGQVFGDRRQPAPSLAAGGGFESPNFGI